VAAGLTGRPPQDSPPGDASTERAAPDDSTGDGSVADGPELFLLGRWRLLVRGTEVEVPRADQRLAALLALRGPSSRAQIAPVLWPGRSVPEAKALLRNNLWRSGHAGGGLLQVDRERLSLGPTVSVDVQPIERAAHDLIGGSVVGGSVVGGGVGRPAMPPERTRADLVDAGDLLDGWFDDWVLAERERLAVLRRSALEVLAERCYRHGLFGEALAAAEAASRLDPLREGPTLTVIRVHLAEGNPALAVRCFDDLRARFRRELGVEPDGRCRELILPHLPASG